MLCLSHLLLSVVVLAFPKVKAFVPVSGGARRQGFVTTMLALTPEHHQDAPADIRQFLNQCSIQSFMFLLTQTRDPHTIKWVDTFTRPTMGPYGSEDSQRLDENGNSYQETTERRAFVANDKKLNSRLLQYHGLSAMNTTIFPTWDSYFKQLLEEPGREIIVQSNNPLVPEFVIDINPASLCSRILSVRNQIAKEWEKDLNVIARMGSQIFYSYHDNLDKERNEWKAQQDKSSEQEHKSTEEPFASSQSGWVPVPPLTSDERSAGFERTSLSFLEWDPNEDSEYAPSPLRKGNFDLLLLLTTQESVRRILLQGTGDSSRASNAAGVEFLRSFYNKRRETYFSRGSGRYGRADDFLEELMLSSPSIVTEKYSEETVLIDPLRLAEVIVLEREDVCKAWAEIARISPEEHMEIVKLQLDRMMNL